MTTLALRPPAPTPKRAVVLELPELEVISRALADLAVDTWGGIKAVPGWETARAKINEALDLCLAQRKAGKGGW